MPVEKDGLFYYLRSGFDLKIYLDMSYLVSYTLFAVERPFLLPVEKDGLFYYLKNISLNFLMSKYWVQLLINSFDMW
jgi:hypothetical protein